MSDDSESTIENRVYLFKDLASSFLNQGGALLASADAGDRKRALRALADLAFVACAVADGEEADPAELAEQIKNR